MEEVRLQDYLAESGYLYSNGYLRVSSLFKLKKCLDEFEGDPGVSEQSIKVGQSVYFRMPSGKHYILAVGTVKTVQKTGVFIQVKETTVFRKYSELTLE